MKSEDFRSGKRYIHKNGQELEFVCDDYGCVARGVFALVGGTSSAPFRYDNFISSVSDAKSDQGDNVMSEYKQGDIVVMNRDVGDCCYENEKLIYERTSKLEGRHIVKNINGDEFSVASDSFHLRDPVKPEFEVDELIEVSNTHSFNSSDAGYFVFNSANCYHYSGSHPFNVVIEGDRGISRHKYARKLQKYTIKYEGVPVEVSKEEFDLYEAQRKRVQAAAKGGDS